MFYVSGSDERGPTDDFWYGPVNGSKAGPIVTDQTALKLAAFYSCAIVKAQTVAQLPLCVYRHLERGREKARELDLWRLVHSRPNRFQTSYQWREMGQLHLDFRGNFYNRIVFDPAGSGRILELIPIHPDRVKVERLTETSHRYLVEEDGDRETPYSMSSILHIAGPTLEGPVGMNPIEFHRETIGKAIATRDFGSEFYRNGATMPGWIEIPGKAGEEARKSLRESWQKAQTGMNRFKTPALDRGMQYHELSLKHTDMQYLESLKNEDIVISQIMRVPPYKIYRLDQAKFNNVEQMQLDFVRDTMVPVAARWEQCLDAQLLDADESESLFFRLEVAGLLRGDTQTRGDYYTKALGSGGHAPWMTQNEVRELEDRNPVEGGDELKEPANSQQPGAEENDGGTDNAASVRARLNSMIEANAARCVTRMVERTRRAVASDKPLADWSAEFFDRHAGFVAEVMQITLGAADAYCNDRELELLAAEDPAAVLERWEQTGAEALQEIASHE